MRTIITRLACALIIALGTTYYVAANYNATVPGSGSPFLSFDVAGVKFPGFILSDAATGTNDVGSAILAAAQGPIPAGLNQIGSVSSYDLVYTGASWVNQLGSSVSGTLVYSATNAPVINGANKYQTIAAGNSNVALTGGGGGAAGDYLSHCVIMPATVTAGAVTILDNATTVYTVPTSIGVSSELIPFSIPIGSISVSGAWKVTTGTNVSVTCTGKFS